MSELLEGAQIAPEVAALRPDYRVMLIVVEGLIGGASDTVSESLLVDAERRARARAEQGPLEELPHICAWRDAYRQFGAKPQRTRNSVEALTRRALTGLPRINWLTDIYNALSVFHELPIGGEDADCYVGSPRLIRAEGTEVFDTVADGADLVEHPDAGEVVWVDDAGVTCRRWNWRQGVRTRLRDDTSRALFILDALDPVTSEDLYRVSGELINHLASGAGASSTGVSDVGVTVRAERRLLTAGEWS